MKFKRNSWLVLCLGFVMSIVGLLIPHFYISNSKINIIGGVDWPSYWFLLRFLFNGLGRVLVIAGFSLTVYGGFRLLFSKTVQTHCSVATSMVSLGLSAVGGLGLFCVSLWFVIVSFNEMDKYPFVYPASIVIGILCFVGVIGLFGMYFKVRKGKWSLTGLLLDCLTVVLYLPTFFFAFSLLYEYISG